MSLSLLDGIGKLGRHLDYIDRVCLQAGAHFVLGPQRDQTARECALGAHNTAWWDGTMLRRAKVVLWTELSG